MTKSERISRLKTEIEQSKERQSKWENEIKWLESSKDMTEPELESEFFKAMLNEKSMFSIETSNKDYQHILGGDGRSQPWDETRTGLVATITCDAYFDWNEWNCGGSKGLKKLIENVLKAKGIDNVNFEY